MFSSLLAEEDREARATALVWRAHQPGRPDPVRVRAERPWFASRGPKQPGPGLLLPHPVQAASPWLLLQWRHGEHQESVRVPHQLHKEMGGQVWCILAVIYVVSYIHFTSTMATVSLFFLTSPNMENYFSPCWWYADKLANSIRFFPLGAYELFTLPLSATMPSTREKLDN